VGIFHGRLERSPTDKIIKLMDRGFAPVAIALSFVAGNGDRSGDERFNHLASFLQEGREKREYSRRIGSHPGNPG
jgi:hypothetical protein